MAMQDIDFINHHKPMGKNLSDEDIIKFVDQILENLPLKSKSDSNSSKETELKNINISRGYELITMEQMQAMWPGVSSEIMKPIMDELNSDLEGYKLDTTIRKAHFMGQVRQEIGSTFSLRENIGDYNSGNLMNFTYYKKHPTEAQHDAIIQPKALK